MIAHESASQTGFQYSSGFNSHFLSYCATLQREIELNTYTIHQAKDPRKLTHYTWLSKIAMEYGIQVSLSWRKSDIISAILQKEGYKWACPNSAYKYYQNLHGWEAFWSRIIKIILLCLNRDSPCCEVFDGLPRYCFIAGQRGDSNKGESMWTEMRTGQGLILSICTEVPYPCTAPCPTSRALHTWRSKLYGSWQFMMR